MRAASFCMFVACLALFASCTSVAPPASGHAVIGSAGGTLGIADVTLTVPAGALSADQTITITATDRAAPAGYELFSPIYDFEPAGIRFARPVTVTIGFRGDAARAQLYWQSETGTGYDQTTSTYASGALTTTVTHFSGGWVGAPVADDAGADDGGPSDGGADDAFGADGGNDTGASDLDAGPDAMDASDAGVHWRSMSGPWGAATFDHVDGSGPDDVWLIGSEAWHWDGATWSLTAWLPGFVADWVAVRSSTEAWAFDGSTLLRWDGTTWRVDSVLATDRASTGRILWSGLALAPTAGVYVAERDCTGFVDPCLTDYTRGIGRLVAWNAGAWAVSYEYMDYQVMAPATNGATVSFLQFHRSGSTGQWVRGNDWSSLQYVNSWDPPFAWELQDRLIYNWVASSNDCWGVLEHSGLMHWQGTGLTLGHTGLRTSPSDPPPVSVPGGDIWGSAVDDVWIANPMSHWDGVTLTPLPSPWAGPAAPDLWGSGRGQVWGVDGESVVYRLDP